MTVSYTDEAKFPLGPDGGSNWGSICNGIFTALDAGFELTLQAGENIEAENVVCLKIDGKIYKASSASQVLSVPIGLAPSAISSGQYGKVRGFGWMDITTPGLSFNAGDAVYLGSTAGTIAKTRQGYGVLLGYCKQSTNNSYDTRIIIQPRHRYAELVESLAIQTQAHFIQEVAHGNMGAARTIDWRLGNKQGGTLDTNCALSFTAPAGPANLVFRFQEDGDGGNKVTWPVAVKWSGGAVPEVSVSPNLVDIFCAYYDGTNYYGSLATSFE